MYRPLAGKVPSLSQAVAKRNADPLNGSGQNNRRLGVSRNQRTRFRPPDFFVRQATIVVVGQAIAVRDTLPSPIAVEHPVFVGTSVPRQAVA